MRTNAPLLPCAFLLLSIFSFSLHGKDKISFTDASTDLMEDVVSNNLSPSRTVLNTVYLEDYGAVADDGKDDGAAIQLAVDANVAGTINYIKSRTGGKFIIANRSVNLDGVNDLYLELHPNAEVMVTGNFPAFIALFNQTSGDVSVTNIVFDGFKIGSEYNANANGGINGSRGGKYNETYVPNGADPNLINPAVIWMGGVQLDGLTFKNMEATNPSNNGYFIKLHNESDTAFTKNVTIDNNDVHSLGGMFVEIVNHATPSENRWENITFTNNEVDDIGIFNHGMALSLSGTGQGANIFGNNTYSNLFIGVELLGANNVNWHDDVFNEGVDHFWSFSKNYINNTAPNKNITVDNITSQYPALTPSIVGNVQNSTFTNVKMLGGGNDRIEVRYSKNVSFYNTEIIGTGYGLFNFTGTNATNSQSNENIKIFEPNLHGMSTGGNPVLTGGGDQLGDVTIYEGELYNEVGPLWIAGGSTAEPKFENVATKLNGVKDILNPYSEATEKTSNSIEFSEVPTDLIVGDSVQVTVNYTISDPLAYVRVRLENPNGDSPREIITSSGTGNHTFTIPVPESSGSGYQWVAELITIDGNWTGLAIQSVRELR